ncbi:hypothetical protein IJH89_02035 [Candidatus Saccharibacteria bacterium]|nr:hypothetical protein [Candidatus Saccharibacteria bacterium]
MVNSKNIIAGLGVVAGLGVAMLPLTTHAADPQDETLTVRATVGEIFELSVTSSEDLEGIDTTKTLEVTKDSVNTTLIHTANVKGNLYKGYDLTLSSVSANTDLKFVKDATKAIDSADRYDTATKISTGTSVAAGTSAWGYKKSETAGSFSGNYVTIKPLANPDTLKSNENSSHASFDDTVYVNYGVSTSEDQAAGVYEAQVIYKATPKI